MKSHRLFLAPVLVSSLQPSWPRIRPTLPRVTGSVETSILELDVS